MISHIFKFPLEIDRPPRAAWPTSVSVPLPAGAVHNAEGSVVQADKLELPVQTKPIAFWPNGSIRWLTASFIVPENEPQLSFLHIKPNTEQRPLPVKSTPGAHDTHVAMGHTAWNLELIVDGRALTLRPVAQVTSTGLIFEEVRVKGVCDELNWLEWEVNGRCWQEKQLVNLSVGLRNTQPATHKGGLWDLGDKNSLNFDRFSLSTSAGTPKTIWLHDGEREYSGAEIQIHQESSGGTNWRSQVHVDRCGDIPMRYCGFETIVDGSTTRGTRAMPTLRFENSNDCLEVTYPFFWENFPSAIHGGTDVRIDFFPLVAGNPHELQPGEQKTHELIISSNQERWYTRHGLRPPIVRVADGSISRALAIPTPCRQENNSNLLKTFVARALDGPRSFLAKREQVDEYGWRHFGDIYADHEELHFAGDTLVSHYNNQYDVLLGMLVQWLQSGDTRWFDLAKELADHVVDIDIYHTKHDRPAYNGGLFWHTDHYKSCSNATHRTYSRKNAKNRTYGGGPACEHNYTTGLLCLYFLTGKCKYGNAVRSLANWVLAMDDGSITRWAGLTSVSTGLASQCYSPDFHGPSRGSGNSISALVDGWLLTSERKYLDFAESLIRRAVHPDDNINDLDLLDVERRWSYTVFLVNLGRYLQLKETTGERDDMYLYALFSLREYGRWMLKHERPYLDHPEDLEFPTETWAAQDLRKANALRLAAVYDTEYRDALLAKANEITDAATEYLNSFPRPDTTRSIAIILMESARDDVLACHRPADDIYAWPKWPSRPDFVPQRTAIKEMCLTAPGLFHLARKMCNISTWKSLLGVHRQISNLQD